MTNLVEKCAVTHSVIMHFDQTSRKFSPVNSQALESRGNSHVAIKGMNMY